MTRTYSLGAQSPVWHVGANRAVAAACMLLEALHREGFAG